MQDREEQPTDPQLLGVDLARVHEAAAKVQPYVRADGTRIWSLRQLERRARRQALVGAQKL